MTRKMIVTLQNGNSPVLSEVPAENEEQLQELLKENPDLLPVDEFEMVGPLMVVGRETTLPSGALDLVALARGGEILLVEFKTGPQNSDFRSALAQLIDYGADLWEMSYERFESEVATRFFEADRCGDLRVKGKRSLEEAARAFWTDISSDELALFRDRIGQQLAGGSFHYVVAAQRFRPAMERTVQYLNRVAPGPRFYAVELVRFAADGVSAYGSRTVHRPARTINSRPDRLSQDEFLARIADPDYRQALATILDNAAGLGYKLYWGTNGMSIRLLTQDGKQVSIGWVMPAGGGGWMGLRDVTLGLDLSQTGRVTTEKKALTEYADAAGQLPNAKQVSVKNMRAFQLDQRAVVKHHELIVNLLTSLWQKATD